MKSGIYRNYMLLTMMVILASNYVDRYVLGLLLQEIKVDLSLSDTQLGLLSGIAFACFYSMMGIPIARWADRGNRITIISIATALWSVAVALCGVAGNFFHLLLIRIGVGVGEAGFAPPSHSLIADYFNRAERARAVGIFKLGIPLGVLIGYLLAGWLNEIYGWRATFMLMGLPGVALAALAWLTLREPRREKPASMAQSTADIQTHPEGTVASTAQPTLMEVFLTLWKNITFRHLMFTWSVAILFGSGISKWQPAFFIRSYGLETGELGTWLAVMTGGGGLIGMYLGGALASRYAVHNERLQFKLMAIAYCSSGLGYLAIFLTSDLYLAFGLMGALCIVGYAVTGPLFATIQSLVPDRMRAMSIAVLYLFANLIGAGLGPLAVGVLSDLLQPQFGQQSLRYALAALCPGYLWVGWHLLRASKTVMRDLEAVAVCPKF